MRARALLAKASPQASSSRPAPSGVIKLRQASSTVVVSISSQAYGRTHTSASHVVNYLPRVVYDDFAGRRQYLLPVDLIPSTCQILPAGHSSRLFQRKPRLRIPSLAMASDPLKYPDTRDTAVISNEFVATNDSESREEESSTGILASAAVRAVDAPPIAVGSQTDDDIDLSSVEGDDATASLTSSLLFAHTMNTAATTQY
ncbi:hypothetical protein E4U31_003496 [Claviceps sp. LM219 group G6]|nr:hypothetical protein E4U31_003496 [Claviceps sp. LM219 group G6]